MKLAIKIATAIAALAYAAAASAQRGETVKIAWIDPLSGLMAPSGSNAVKTFQFFADKFSGSNNPAGVRFEVVPFDSKLSPAESLSALKSASDKGIRYITAGGGSAAVAALIDGVNKHNARNPGKEVLLLNYAAVDPDLTDSKCSYWHFRFDANTSMKMEALTTFLKDDKDIRKVYLFNQNYAHGHQMVRLAKENLARKRPDVEIVGEDLHPLAQVRDFAPYIAKIKASGADTVITGNWGSDLALLIKAASESGFDGKFYTLYAGMTGTPAALGEGGGGRVFQIANNHYNMGGDVGKWTAEFKERFKEDLYFSQVSHVFMSLGETMAKTRSTDPVKVAAAMEGLRFKGFNGEVEMRKTDHQMQQLLFMTVWQKADDKYPHSVENTGMTLAPVRAFPAYIASTPTSCQMKRP
ncbi:branched-chain amino acid ABC transporter substrate-binding protein [Variovorax paradoxus]|uniref:branched-chain amino acid ABC transporter substrate-binding protein n=1 Tax=Variovorax paradoxus TaxID=34073 RepID=UPI003ED032EA